MASVTDWDPINDCPPTRRRWDMAKLRLQKKLDVAGLSHTDTTRIQVGLINSLGLVVADDFATFLPPIS